MTDARVQQVLASPPEGMLLTAVSVSRAISAKNLAALEDFYVNGVGASVSSSIDAEEVVQRCYNWPGTGGDVCFRKRPDSSTDSSFAPQDFEDMLEATHEHFLKDPKCGMMRWEDNHYAIDLAADLRARSTAF